MMPGCRPESDSAYLQRASKPFSSRYAKPKPLATADDMGRR
jgi:hypothetical protein